MNGRKALVTGAGSGIGRAAAELLAREGASVVVLDVDADSAGETARKIGGYSVTLDLLNEAKINAAISEAARLMGGLDCIVNCAGIRQISPLEEIDSSAWARVIGINLTAPFAIVRAALPWLRKAPGVASIVNISSAAGLRPAGAQIIGYSASKAGLLGMTKAMAIELAPDIRVNAICPGLVDTPMTAFAFEGLADKRKAPDVAKYALQRPADPSEIAAGILFLAGIDGSFVTGATLVMDGGRTFY